MRLASRRPLALLALALLPACREVVRVEERIGAVYVLRTVAGAPTPVRPLPGVSYEILADTLFFGIASTGVQHVVIRTIPDSVVIENEVAFRWWLEGTRMRVLMECPLTRGLAPCPREPSFEGTMNGDRWVVQGSDRYGVPALFERLH